MNFKKLCLALVATIIVSCDDGNSIEPFDYKRQYETEKPVIDEYLTTHYFDAVDEDIKEIDEGQMPLSEDSNLQDLSAIVNDVNYTMYSYVYKQGENEEAGSPDADDIVNISFIASSFEGTPIQEYDSNDGFLSLKADIKGFRVGLPMFRGGTYNEDSLEEPREYEGVGEGFLIIPSGLSVLKDENIIQDARTVNQPLVCKIELRSVISAGEDL